MSESQEHRNYVQKIVDYIKDNINSDYNDRIFADLDGYNKPSLSYDSFIPDVMYKYNRILIIGEAKTISDFEREHSKKQYLAYLNECSKYPFDSFLIISLPINTFITAKNHFKLLKRNNPSYKNTKIIILSDGGIEERI